LYLPYESNANAASPLLSLRDAQTSPHPYPPTDKHNKTAPPSSKKTPYSATHSSPVEPQHPTTAHPSACPLHYSDSTSSFHLTTHQPHSTSLGRKGGIHTIIHTRPLLDLAGLVARPHPPVPIQLAVMQEECRLVGRDEDVAAGIAACTSISVSTSPHCQNARLHTDTKMSAAM
jgi:hypothetical protein